MKDTILNLAVIAAVFASIVSSVIESAPAQQAVAAQASRVFQMEKTVVIAKAETMLVASAAQ